LDDEEDRRRAALSAMETLTATILHELIQPLAVATSQIERLNRLKENRGLDADEAATADSIERLRHAVGRCLQIITRMRAMVLDGEAIRSAAALDSIIRDAVRMIEGSPGFNRVSLEIETLEVYGMVHCDSVQIEQVLVNLLLNAITATRWQPSPQVRIRAVSRSTFTLGRFVELIVEDNGPGVPAADEEDLFRPLHRMTAGHGGLGLAICKSIIEGHGGSIWYERRRSRGASFHFTLPQAPQ
jgi:signal transduction histidine kinase